MSYIEYPTTVLTGDLESRIKQINTYLTRLADTLNHSVEDNQENYLQRILDLSSSGNDLLKADSRQDSQSLRDSYRKTFDNLRSLIISTAHTVIESETEPIINQFTREYEALSNEFGSFRSSINTQVAQNADGVSILSTRLEGIDSELDMLMGKAGYINLGWLDKENTWGLEIGQLADVFVVKEENGVTHSFSNIDKFFTRITPQKMSFMFQGSSDAEATELASISTDALNFPNAHITGGTINIGNDGHGGYNFSVDSTGHVKANSLTLGSNASVPYEKVDNVPDFALSSALSSYVVKNGNIEKLGNDTFLLGSDPDQYFQVSKDGLLEAKNAVIYGTVYASAGEIGGWSIAGHDTGANGMYNHSLSSVTEAGGYKYAVILRGGVNNASISAITVRKMADNLESTPQNWATAPALFSVGFNGKLTATDADITGKITATQLILDGATIPYKKVDNVPDFALSSALNSYVVKNGKIEKLGEDTLVLGDTPADGVTGFKVSKTGLLEASNAVIFGTVYASEGEFTGKITASSGSIGNFAIAGSDQASNGFWPNSISQIVKDTANNKQYAVFMGGFTSKDGAFIGVKEMPNNVASTSSAWTNTATLNFCVRNTGKIFATDADIKGKITATQLILDGATIPYNKVDNVPDFALSSALNSYVVKNGKIEKLGEETLVLGDTPADGVTGFKVSKTGLLEASNAVIFGTVYASEGEFTGKITASSGSIAGFEIAGSTYPSNGSYNNSISTVKTDTTAGKHYNVWLRAGTAPTSTVFGIREMSSEYESNSTNWFDSSKYKDNFILTAAGKLKATDADITGKITASSGSIGNFAIAGSDQASNGFWPNSISQIVKDAANNKQYAVFMGGFTSKDGAFIGVKEMPNNVTSTSSAWTNTATLNFCVRNTGKIFATDADITGKITATEGNIGGWNISSENGGISKSISAGNNASYSFTFGTADKVLSATASMDLYYFTPSGLTHKTISGLPVISLNGDGSAHFLKDVSTYGDINLMGAQAEEQKVSIRVQIWNADGQRVMRPSILSYKIPDNTTTGNNVDDDTANDYGNIYIGTSVKDNDDTYPIQRIIVRPSQKGFLVQDNAKITGNLSLGGSVTSGLRLEDALKVKKGDNFYSVLESINGDLQIGNYSLNGSLDLNAKSVINGYIDSVRRLTVSASGIEVGGNISISGGSITIPNNTTLRSQTTNEVYYNLIKMTTGNNIAIGSDGFPGNINLNGTKLNFNGSEVALKSDIPSLSGYLTTSAASSTYFPKSGGTISGTVTASGNINLNNGIDLRGKTKGGSAVALISMTGGDRIQIGGAGYTGRFEINAGGTHIIMTDNKVYIGSQNGDIILRPSSSGKVYINNGNGNKEVATK